MSHATVIAAGGSDADDERAADTEDDETARGSDGARRDDVARFRAAEADIARLGPTVSEESQGGFTSILEGESPDILGRTGGAQAVSSEVSTASSAVSPTSSGHQVTPSQDYEQPPEDPSPDQPEAPLGVLSEPVIVAGRKGADFGVQVDVPSDAAIADEVMARDVTAQNFSVQVDMSQDSAVVSSRHATQPPVRSDVPQHPNPVHTSVKTTQVQSNASISSSTRAAAGG